MALPLTPFNHVYVDYEYVGDISKCASACEIWNIGAVKSSGETFDAYINVNTSHKTHPGCVEVTEEYLAERNAVDFSTAFQRFVDWVGPQAVLISHNAFRSDKPVLESECTRHGITIPAGWKFYDSLLFLRSQIQCMSYRLADVYETVTSKVLQQAHTALLDAIGLKEILDLVPPHGLYTYPKYLTPLQNIKWVGAACENALVTAGVRSVEDLILKYTQWVQLDGCTITLMKQFLSQFRLPCVDLAPIAAEIVKVWLPATHGGGKIH
jgi:DNA polymerase III epsilon subunit-like protein